MHDANYNLNLSLLNSHIRKPIFNHMKERYYVIISNADSRKAYYPYVDYYNKYCLLK